MAIRFKQKCSRCGKNYVKVSRRQSYIQCYDCQKSELHQEIKDSKMKKFFDIPEEFYKENAFLRSIKVNYLRYGGLSERQIETFKKSVKKMHESSQDAKAG